MLPIPFPEVLHKRTGIAFEYRVINVFGVQVEAGKSSGKRFGASSVARYGNNYVVLRRRDAVKVPLQKVSPSGAIE